MEGEDLDVLLEQFAEERADDVEDVSIEELRQLILDGANWMRQKLEKSTD